MDDGRNDDSSALPLPAGEGRCSFCSAALAGRDEVACARCHTHYHLRCWDTYQRCAVYGCGSRAYVYVVPPAVGSDGAVAAPSTDDGDPAVEFDRSSFVLYVVFAAAGMVSAVIGAFLLAVLLSWFGLAVFPGINQTLGHRGPELLFVLASFCGGLFAALPARERFRFDFGRGKLSATVTWSGRGLLSFDLADIDAIRGLAVDELDGRLYAYYVSAPSLARRGTGLGLRQLAEYTATDAHTFAGRTLLSVGPRCDDRTAVEAWLRRLEDLASRLDRGLLLPQGHACVGMLPEAPQEPARRALPAGEAKPPRPGGSVQIDAGPASGQTQDGHAGEESEDRNDP